tara:strand:+ start:9478 stop:9975 length:498 start_codon:yes stop_codon:yes gene_type:complete
MPLLKDGKIIEDIWVQVYDDADVPATGGAMVSLERWLSQSDTLRGRNAPVGVLLKSGQSPAQLLDALNDLDLVVLDFPAYTDGRSYSAAKLLRQRYGFDGEIRAVGNVLRDQYAAMLRCGFDAFEVADDIDPAAWAASAAAMSNGYQHAVDGAQAIWAKRHGISA